MNTWTLHIEKTVKPERDGDTNSKWNSWTVQENETREIFKDISIKTDHPIPGRLTDLVLIDKKNVLVN